MTQEPKWKLQSANLTLQGDAYVGQVSFANENAGGQFSPRTLVLSVKPDSNEKLKKMTSDIAKQIESLIK